jgi:hypothetical protein
VDVRSINQHLQAGRLATPGLFPHLEMLRRGGPPVFRIDFGLDALPEQPGVLLIRGPRQYGKSTWLESQLEATIATAGAAAGYYLNGDHISDADALVDAIRELVPWFRAEAPVRRLFIDEITAIPAWEKGLKRLLDAGELRDVLVVTTGSRATDLRRGAERLPGRRVALRERPTCSRPCLSLSSRGCAATISAPTRPRPTSCAVAARSARPS